MTVCKGCGAEIVWGEDRQCEGTPIMVPLDVKAPVYRVLMRNRDGRATWDVVRDRDCAVSHFATCPEASRFSCRSRVKFPTPPLPSPVETEEVDDQ